MRGHSSKTGGAFVIVNNYCAFKTPGSEIDNKYQPGHFILLDTYIYGWISAIQTRLSFWQFNGSNTNDHPNNQHTPSENLYYLNLIRFLKPSHCHLYKSQCNGNHVAMAYGCLDWNIFMRFLSSVIQREWILFERHMKRPVLETGCSRNIPYGQSSAKLPVIMLSCHRVIMSSCHHVILT